MAFAQPAIAGWPGMNGVNDGRLWAPALTADEAKHPVEYLRPDVQPILLPCIRDILSEDLAVVTASASQVEMVSEHAGTFAEHLPILQITKSATPRIDQRDQPGPADHRPVIR
ncbi:hypothetical protein M3484_20720 [Pseudomonas sp. GX19020]|uniref:hypothetical protein n=1 Tax=Pseudomonas sp. GX19020 TaxID=2942277 RepID=UPI002018611C|nr:hypothetical protein [Pseudomonas sp. GX19020]MCL4068984.1 hypothetical protein [Pseudomonas sp. GX19020]